MIVRSTPLTPSRISIEMESEGKEISDLPEDIWSIHRAGMKQESGSGPIRFAEDTVRATGRKTMGVKGITMSFKDDYVVGMLVVKREGSILVATDKGYGKRSDVDAYRTQNRGGKGVYTVKSTPKVGNLVSIMEVVDEDDIMIITNKGIMIRQPVENIKVIGRNTQGVKLLRLDDGAFISSITKVLNEDEEVQDEASDSEETPNSEE